jgi:hypothetical protein
MNSDIKLLKVENSIQEYSTGVRIKTQFSEEASKPQ